MIINHCGNFCYVSFFVVTHFSVLVILLVWFSINTLLINAKIHSAVRMNIPRDDCAVVILLGASSFILMVVLKNFDVDGVFAKSLT